MAKAIQPGLARRIRRSFWPASVNQAMVLQSAGATTQDQSRALSSHAAITGGGKELSAVFIQTNTLAARAATNTATRETRISQTNALSR